jgi:hypothetical protein
MTKDEALSALEAALMALATIAINDDRAELATRAEMGELATRAETDTLSARVDALGATILHRLEAIEETLAAPAERPAYTVKTLALRLSRSEPGRRVSTYRSSRRRQVPRTTQLKARPRRNEGA